MVVVDSTKLVLQLRGPVPVEILRFGADATLAALDAACGVPLQPATGAGGAPEVSNSGNLLGDGHFDAIVDPEGLARRLDAIPGVVGHGLFLGMADLVLVGDEAGEVREITGLRRPRLG